MSRRFISPATPPFSPPPGGGASERGKAQPEPKRHRAGGGERKRSELGNRAGLPPPLAEGAYQQTTLSSLDVAQATPALPTSPPPLPVRSASQVPGPGFRFLLHTESRGLSGSPAEGGAARGAYVQRLTHARTASLSMAKQFRHCEDREGTVTSMT